ncbi:biliverdin-producing heme oxygenase [Massilia yuzhufengensis]|uniref:Heme oxygenase n=1 Tax=Massilia yuzhufengensis TaxID=1164594 RepID=A0A1I1MMP6_9BURK|nr:biliverdin-producing heme oxygenase [Massilia yuzhufengensis]SFC86774.1 Heme oxygenase [Massilia yuzhufengensis]
MNRPNDSARDTDVLAALRAATATRHEALDSGLPLSAPGASLADYAAHLRMLRDWLAPLQAWLAGFPDGPQAHAALPPVPRLALIDADLAEPGLPGEPAARPPAVWPLDASAAYRWGAAYVIEGSQLGGAVLYARLAGPLAPHPLRYLRGDAGGPGPRWRAFMQALRAAVRTPEEIADACAGACAAFDVILAPAPVNT